MSTSEMAWTVEDLHSLFDALNHKYLNDAVTKVPLYVNIPHVKGQLDSVSGRTLADDNGNVVSIHIKPDLPVNVLADILLHEMTHVLVFQSGVKHDHSSPQFIQQCNLVSLRHGWDIISTETDATCWPQSARRRIRKPLFDIDGTGTFYLPDL